ncbi:MAG: hypothetical protein HZB62_14595 [Nitrospirae bacterium]|nr:hypothetical protein [Nitrospirota bacterium]
MGVQSLLIKTAFLIPYLIIAVMFPCSRGERLQKYHFFQLTERYHAVPLYNFPIVGNTSVQNHQHLSLFFYPAKGTPTRSEYFPAAPSTIVPDTELPVMAAGRLKVFSGVSPPLFYSKTVSGLSPPQSSYV